MPADLATLQARLDALKTTLGSGRLEVSYNGRMTRYRSMVELQAAIKDVETDIASLSGTKVLRTYRFSSSKDL